MAILRREKIAKKKKKKQTKNSKNAENTGVQMTHSNVKKQKSGKHTKKRSEMTNL